MTQLSLSVVQSRDDLTEVMWAKPGEGSGERRAAQTTTVIMKTKCLVLAAKPHPGCCERVPKAGLRLTVKLLQCRPHRPLRGHLLLYTWDTSREVWERFEVCLLLNTMRSVMLLEGIFWKCFFFPWGEN